MIVRRSIPDDLTEIVKVLKASLGEVELPITEEIWQFKHDLNPFGKSLVLVAEEDGALIGVRAFMAWEWKMGDKTFKAYRAVDTATHPDHQGKGIFKKLTLEALEEAKKSGIEFVFNTPNDQSRPGYLKMGWQTVGKINVGIKPSFISFLSSNKLPRDYEIVIEDDNFSLDTLCKEWNSNLQKKNLLFTSKTSSFLQWRYRENLLQKYEVFQDADIFIAGYIKQRKKIKELRISECIYRKTTPKKIISEIIIEWSNKHGVQVISYSPELLNIGFLNLKGNYGPILIIRELNLNSVNSAKLSNIENWANSIGDLELF